jgi:4-amino-4-deoxy-L-arabinose transferase-like glycosyltransferase
MADNKIMYPILLIFIGMVFFFPFLGSVPLFDWDEVNFAESAREMLVTGDYFRVHIDFEPFTEKPPLFFWLQTASMNVFGVNEFAARFPNALTGVIVLLIIYFIGKKLENPRFGLIWALSFWGSLLPHIYFRSGIIDPVFNLFMFMSILFLALSVRAVKEKDKNKNALWAGVFTGLAVLTKGPVGFLVVFLSFLVFWAFRRFRKLTGFRQVLVYALSVLVVSFAWYGVETIRYGPDFLRSFIIRQVEIFTTSDAGHGQPFYYHFVVLLAGCFPVSFIAISNLMNDRSGDFTALRDFRIWIISALIVVLTVFSISTTKIVHYSSMAYYPITFLAALEINRWITNGFSIKKWVIYTGIILTLLLSVSLLAVGLFSGYITELLLYVKDPFVAAILTTDVKWNGNEWIPGMLFLAGSITGWILLMKRRIIYGVGVLFCTTAITIFFFSAMILPKVEQYTQGPYIRFFESLRGENVYVGTVGYKSYAHLYYSDKQPGQPRQMTFNELMDAELEVPVFLSVKLTHEHRMDKHPEFELIGRDGGFLFYRKDAVMKKE